MSVEINGTIYAGEEKPLPAAGGGAAQDGARAALPFSRAQRTLPGWLRRLPQR